MAHDATPAAGVGRRTIRLKIKRQDGPTSPAYWQDFEIPYKPSMNVISCLLEIQKRPATTSGQGVAPPTWDQACLEEVCGSCTMVI
ncbi:MAG TPA: 2Fe-2S iron-sulfur cluster-binding protein, partial [Planctomycetota bacterium]|nr:2Fe-2S iron-sulfur cluster-binding protein [Planctomycetota bacterium]